MYINRLLWLADWHGTKVIEAYVVAIAVVIVIVDVQMLNGMQFSSSARIYDKQRTLGIRSSSKEFSFLVRTDSE